MSGPGRKSITATARVPALAEEPAAVLRSLRLSPSHDSQQLPLPMQKSVHYCLACTYRKKKVTSVFSDYLKT